VKAEEKASEKGQGDSSVKEVRLTIPILQDMELAGTRLADTVAKYTKLTEDEIDEVRMAIIEACLNAFKHSRSRDGQVEIKFTIRPDEVEVTIEDRGIGFNPESVQSPAIDRQLKGGGRQGWGLTIIKGLMDKVDIKSSSEGTRITMTKKCQSRAG
jgi:serine/threonine-protein kinase RsbW